MKLLVYAVAAAILASLGARLVDGLPLRELDAPKKAIHSAAVERIVYVNTSELARLHPSWEALQQMRTTLAEVKSASGGVSFDRGTDRMDAVPTVKNAPRGISRKALEAEAARAAIQAYDKLEAQKQDALRARTRAMRSMMIKSAESSINTEARNTEESAAVDMKAVDDAHGNDLLNAQLRAAALQAQTKVSGIDQNVVANRLKSAKANVNGIISASDAEKDRISAVTEAKINDLRKAAEADIDKHNQDFEAQESDRISKGIRNAREEIITEIGTFRIPDVGNAGTIAPTAAPNAAGPVVKANGDDLAQLRASASELEAKIARDVNRMVIDLGAKRGMKVVFTRDRSGVPDATRLFADLMRKHGWSAGGPILGGLGSS